VIFAGELTRNKGVPLLLEAWSIAALEGFSLLLVGDGPERNSIQEQHARLPRVTWCGRRNRAEVLEHIAASRILVFPSLAYENCPMVVLEALSVATPVVAANHPGLQTMIAPQREGLLFQTGDPQALAAALRDALTTDHETWSRWSSAARRTHAERYSEDVSYGQLISIYRSVIQSKSTCVSDVDLDAAVQMNNSFPAEIIRTSQSRTTLQRLFHG
jgi:glycosyltransferase involved in cell wall biosynthesis